MNPRIEIDPQIHHGMPVIRGTRVPVVSILGEIAEGMSREEVAQTYRVSIEDVVAAIAYAADLVVDEQERLVHSTK
jgi:uncharacterized protein (DUF433 family)